jgi:hypothetical protein
MCMCVRACVRACGFVFMYVNVCMRLGVYSHRCIRACIFMCVSAFVLALQVSLRAHIMNSKSTHRKHYVGNQAHSH